MRKREAKGSKPITRTGAKTDISVSRIVVIYTAVSILWILFSDALLNDLFNDIDSLQIASTLKGTLFVAVTALLLYTLMHRLERQISAAAQREQTLQAAQLRTLTLLESITSHSPDVIIIKDRAGRYLVANQATAELLGKPVEQIIGADDFALLPAAIARQVRVDDERIMASGQTETYEEVVTERAVEQTLLTTKGPLIIDGAIEGVFAIARDISPMKQAQQTLLESQERLLEAEQVARIGNWELDIASGQAYWSEAIHQIFDTDPGEKAGPELLASRVVAEDWPIVDAALSEAIRGGEEYRAEYRIQRTDGELRWIHSKAKTKRDEQGQPITLTGMIQDITERKLIEQQLARAGHEWTQAMDHFEDVIYLLDMQSHLLRANKAFYRMVDSTPEQCQGRTIAELIHPHGEGTPCPICQAQAAHAEALFTLEPTDHHNPGNRPLEVSLKLVRDEADRATGIMVSMHDLSRSRQIEERLRLAASVFENTDEGVIITDVEGNIVEVNRAFTDILGYTRDEVVGKNPRLLKSGRHDQNFYRDLWHTLIESGHWHGEMWNRRKNGELFPAWQTISSVVDEQGRLTHFVGVFADISQIKHSQQQLQHLAHHDALTNLPNRLLLNERIDQAIRHAERHKSQLALIFLDLDRFKNINDSLGHPVGDELLQAVAQKLITATREDDTIARIGGDEFVLLLEDIGKPEHAGIAAQKLTNLFSEPFCLEGHTIRITASLGICICPQDGGDPATLLRNADSAMYRAKEAGRNTYQFYTAELTRNAFERVLLENNLRQAIDKEQLRLLYQPQFDLQGGKVIGLEALVRWEHPELGTISPVKFIPLAEESGLIHQIGNWVLLTACRQGQRWLEQGIDFGRIAVNIAGPQLQRGNLLNEVISALKETGLPTDRLELEITEGFIMQQAESAITQLQALRELGVTLAIDDFGTGYSSLSYLKQLPIHKLKIDQSFVRDIPDDKNDMAIADAVIAMGRSLNLTVIAEGVETEAQAAFLSQAGCQEVQGYLYSKPVDPERITQRLLQTSPDAQPILPGSPRASP